MLFLSCEKQNEKRRTERKIFDSFHAKASQNSRLECFSYSAFRNFFPKLCLILKEWFLTRFPPYIQEDSLCSQQAPNLFFGVQSKNSLNRFKGSVERSLLPWAIFLIFTRNRPWKSEDYLCTLFFIEMSKERLEKSKRTPPVSWRPWALAYSPDRPYNFSCLSAVSKTRRFGSFFLGFGVSFGEEKPFVNSNASF